MLEDQQNVRPIKELLQTLYVSLCSLVQDMGKSVLVGNINIWVHRMENILQWQQQLDNIQINRVSIAPRVWLIIGACFLTVAKHLLSKTLSEWIIKHLSTELDFCKITKPNSNNWPEMSVDLHYWASLAFKLAHKKVLLLVIYHLLWPLNMPPLLDKTNVLSTSPKMHIKTLSGQNLDFILWSALCSVLQ